MYRSAADPEFGCQAVNGELDARLELAGVAPRPRIRAVAQSFADTSSASAVSNTNAV
jgi:hypothetical protein